MSSIKGTLLFSLVAAFAVVLVQNTHEAVIRFFVWHGTLPMIVLLALTLLVGILVGLLMQPNTRSPEAILDQAESNIPGDA